MAFISSRPYTYDEDSLEFGRELSQRAALAMDHARLSRQVQGMVGKETA
jgi:GAF domain-containing protein